MKRDHKSLKPGWRITQGQWLSLWRMWGDACKQQGWDKLPPAAREEKRHEVFAELGFASAKDIDKTTGFDKVKRRLEELVGKVHASGEGEGERTRLLHRIGETFAELAELGYSAEATAKILKDFGVVPGVRGITDLSEDRLLTLSRTLTRIVGEQKEAA